MEDMMEKLVPDPFIKKNEYISGSTATIVIPFV